jgi:tetratricopeptide (TPR) repeat protein
VKEPTVKTPRSCRRCDIGLGLMSLAMVGLLLSATPAPLWAAVAHWAGIAVRASEDFGVAAPKKKKTKAKKAKGKKGKGKTSDEQGEAESASPAQSMPAVTPSAPPAPPAPPAPVTGAKPAAAPAPVTAPVLDLSKMGTDTGKARDELLKGSTETSDAAKKGKTKAAAGAFDFGGDIQVKSTKAEFDFGSDLQKFDLGAVDIGSAERGRFEKAIGLMSSEDYAKAAVEFRFFLKEPKFAEFKQESQYQLAKALYKLGFYDSALAQFEEILEQGPSHRRYGKAVEWLFFVSRKLADDTPVLAELARFRNVTWPKAYRSEYRYLLSKYLFVQAERFTVERMQAEQLARGKKSKEATFDFDKAADQIKSGGAFDFSGLGATDTSGSFDFSGGSGRGGGAGGGGFDFGGSGGGGEATGALDFGGGSPAAAPAPAAPERGEAPSTAKEAIHQGMEFIKLIETDNPFYPRAKYLEGLLDYLDGADQDAVKAFQEVVRVLNPREGARLDPKLRELAFLSLARIHYGYQQFEKSAYYYDLIDRDSENWLTALFEASWAYYRRGDFDRALGNLLTLHSPFFEREYFPESQLVKAIIYFEACRYKETREFVDRFVERYTQVMKEIERIAEWKEAPEKLYDRIGQLQKQAVDEKNDVTARLVSLASTDQEIRRARKVAEQAQQELKNVGEMPEEFRASPLAQEIRDKMNQLLGDRIKAAGEVTRNRFEQELYALKGLLGQALRIKLEVARSEREMIEAKMQGKSSDEVVPAQARTVVDDEHVYWPYEGEYWRDELGTYQLDFSMCRR